MMRLISLWLCSAAVGWSSLAGAQSQSHSPGASGLSIKSQKIQGVGIRVASQAAVGKTTYASLNYAQAALMGLAIITNNNDNDGQPATFTGGSGSNMAGGG